MNFLVIDDDKEFLEVIKMKLSNIFVNVTCDTFRSFPPEYLLKDEYNVIMLDLIIGKESGIDVAKRLKKRFPKAHIVCVSNFNELVFETQILGSTCFVRKQKLDYDLEVMKQLLYKCKGKNKEIIIRLDNSNHIDASFRVVKVNTDDIVYAESYSHKITIVTLKGNYITNMSFKKFKEIIDECECFAQIHRSCILNMNYIYQVTGNDVEIVNLKYYANILQIGRKYKKSFIEEFERFLLL